MVADRLLVERCDERAPVRLDGDPALLFERDQRLPDGDPADAERLGDVVLGHPAPGVEVAVEDQLADVERRRFTAAPAVQLALAEAIPVPCRVRFYGDARRRERPPALHVVAPDGGVGPPHRSPSVVRCVSGPERPHPALSTHIGARNHSAISASGAHRPGRSGAGGLGCATSAHRSTEPSA